MNRINWAQELKKSARKIIQAGIKDLEDKEIKTNILIHDSRKRVKNSRAILRLIRFEVGEKNFKSLNILLRNLNRKSANIRKAYVLIDIIEKELEDSMNNGVRTILHNLKSKIENELVSSQPKINTNQILREYHDSFIAFKKLIDNWDFKKKNFSLINIGLSEIYEKGQIFYKMALKKQEVPIFHEMRKNAKDLLYALEIIRKGWPPVIKTYINQTKILTDQIGKMHDLYELKLEINKYYKGNEIEDLLKTSDERIKNLIGSSELIGQKIYAEKTKNFISRMKIITSKRFDVPESRS